jgi:NAD-dependent deacetylase
MLPGDSVQAHYLPMTIPAELIRQLAAAKRVTGLTGAGVSAESGVPTFRDAQTGLWANFKPEDLATLWAFQFSLIFCPGLGF